MMRTVSSSLMSRWALVLIATLAFVAVGLNAEPAAADRGPVPIECYAFGHPLLGLSEAEVRALVEDAAPVSTLPTLTVRIDERTFRFSLARAVSVDATAMLEAAYDTATVPGTVIAPVYRVERAYLSRWLGRVASAIDRPARDARYRFRPWGIAVDPGRRGRRVDRQAIAGDLARRALTAASAPDASQEPTVAVYRSLPVRQRVTRAQLGRAIAVDLSERRVLLYSSGRVVRRYRCAVGMPSYPTPAGTFRVVRKVKWPVWVNPAPHGWGADLPARIGPGPSNPLGTRALYLNVGGIRIHGTPKRRSIGTASSHGCIRMLREDIEELFPLVPVGTPVHIVK